MLAVWVDGLRLRLWQAAPALRWGMSSLDVERFCHLGSRLGVELCLRTLQVRTFLTPCMRNGYA